MNKSTRKKCPQCEGRMVLLDNGTTYYCPYCDYEEKGAIKKWDTGKNILSYLEACRGK